MIDTGKVGSAASHSRGRGLKASVKWRRSWARSSRPSSKPCELGRSIEGGDAVAAREEGFCVAAGAAAGVEDQAAVGDVGEEAVVQRAQVDVDRVGEEARGVGGIPGEGVGRLRRHGWREYPI